MVNVVRFFDTSRNEVKMSCSVRLSSADVASSNTKIFGSLRIVRAIATRCFFAA